MHAVIYFLQVAALEDAAGMAQRARVIGTRACAVGRGAHVMRRVASARPLVRAHCVPACACVGAGVCEFMRV